MTNRLFIGAMIVYLATIAGLIVFLDTEGAAPAATKRHYQIQTADGEVCHLVTDDNGKVLGGDCK
jgi:hypothetical protein